MAANRLLRTSAWRDDDGRIVLDFSVATEQDSALCSDILRQRLYLTTEQSLNLANKLISATWGAVGGKPGEQQARTNHTPEPPAAA